MATTFASALTTLNTTLDDTGNVTFTSDQKTRALTKAWNDPYVVEEAWDTTLTYTQGTYQYTVPSALTTVRDIYISPTGSSQPMPEPIDPNLYEVVDGKIQFNQRADNIIPSTYTLYIRGNYKLTTSDSITNNNLLEYVLAVAGYNTLGLLGYQKANLFLKNDTTMGELIALRREFERDIVRLKALLPKAYEGS